MGITMATDTSRPPHNSDGYSYLTKEQLGRMAGLSQDALIGIQFYTDANDDSYVYGSFVRIDNPNEQTFFTIYPDGSWKDET